MVGIRNFYAGREFDSFTELSYNRARWYDPAAGRFISEDPIGFAGGDANIYRYAGNSPDNATDPSGHIINVAAASVGAAAGAIIGGVSYAVFSGDDFTWAGLSGAVGVGGLAGGAAGLTFGASLAFTGVGAGGGLGGLSVGALTTATTAAGAVGGAFGGGLNAGVQTGFTDGGAIASGVGTGLVVGAAAGLAFGVTAGGAAMFLPAGLAGGVVATTGGSIASDFVAQRTSIGLGRQSEYSVGQTIFSGGLGAVGSLIGGPRAGISRTSVPLGGPSRNVSGLTAHQAAQLEQKLLSIPGANKVRVFGSRTKGTSSTKSDLDIALFGDTDKSAPATKSIVLEAQQLARQFGIGTGKGLRPLDITTSQSVSAFNESFRANPDFNRAIGVPKLKRLE